MSFGEAVSSGLRNYVNFEGRAVRAEYWYWVLFVVLVSLVASFADAMVGTVVVISTIASLILLLPGIAVAVRRLHDSGKTGWNMLWGLLPFGVFYVLYLMLRPSTTGENAYGG